MKLFKLLFLTIPLFIALFFVGCASDNNSKDEIPNIPPEEILYFLHLDIIDTQGGSVNNINEYYTYATQVTLTATPNEGYMFSSWHDTSGYQSVYDNPYTILITKNTTIEVFFVEIPEDDHFEYYIVNDEVFISKYINSSTLDDGNVVVPESIEGYPVTTILPEAFAYADIHSVTFPSTLTTINSKAFYFSYVSNVYFSSSITYIGGEAFRGNNFTSITLPDSLKEIGPSAFYGQSLAQVYIPISVIKIGFDAFGHNSFQVITTQHTKKPSGWDRDWAYEQASVIWSSSEHDLVSDQLIFSLNSDDTLSVVSYYGEIYSIVDLIIPSLHKGKEVRVIGKDAFRGSIGLKTVVIPDSISIIEDRAFYYCHQLLSVELPSHLEFLGSQVFYNCTSLISIVLPSSLTYVGSSVFTFCTEVVIYVEALSLPLSWNEDWDIFDLCIYWGSQWYYNESGKPEPLE
jgi:hypothetical protein